MLRVIIGLAVGLSLAGCSGFDLGSDPAPVKRAALLGGAVGVAGPEGFCVDVADSRLARGFALMAPCASLGLEGVSYPARPALITVQAGRTGTAAVTGSEPAFAGFLETANGAALLSQSGVAETISAVSTSTSENKVVVSFEDSEDTPLAGTQDREWRGFVDIDGRLVTIAVRGIASEPLGESGGAALMDAAIAAVIAANAS